jgi:hypothetical protein
MKKIGRSLLFFSLFVIILLQFFQPIKNEGKVTADHLYQNAGVPGPVQTILNNACMDCHSDHTNYRWYHRIFPVSWYIHTHIEEGKKELNFSDWGTIGLTEQLRLLGDIGTAVERGEMPLASYRLVHVDARLSRAQKDTLTSWIRAYREQLVKKVSR